AADVAGDGSQVVSADAEPGALEQTQEGDRRRGVGHDLEPRHEVDDLGPHHQAAGPDDLDGDLTLLEGGDDGGDQPALAAQHGAVVPRPAGAGDVVGDGGRLLGVVGGEEALDDRVGHAVVVGRLQVLAQGVVDL